MLTLLGGLGFRASGLGLGVQGLGVLLVGSQDFWVQGLGGFLDEL